MPPARRAPAYPLTILIAGLIAAIPFAAMWSAGPPATNPAVRWFWPYAEARVLERVELPDQCGRDQSRRAFRYRLAVTGSAAQGDVIVADRFCNAYAVGDAITVRFDPADPTRLMTRLETGIPFGFTPWTIGLGYALLFAFAFAITHLVRRDAFRPRG